MYLWQINKIFSDRSYTEKTLGFRFNFETNKDIWTLKNYIMETK